MHRIKFFLPFWWDHVFEDFDPWNDTWKGGVEHHKYLWELQDEVPFDGVLFSRVKVEDSKKMLERIKENGGIRDFLRIPRGVPLFGDCGAFGYVNQTKPPYDPIETLQFYEDMEYNLACTVDHLITKSSADDREYRFNLVLDNAKKMIDDWNHKDYSFELIGVAQGWDPYSYRNAVKQLIDMGFQYMALGGLVRSSTKQIADILKACYPLWKRNKVKVHLFGMGRWSLFPLLKKLEVESVDNAYHRKAWLSGKNNYEIGGDAYTAVRIPLSDKRTKERISEEQKVFDRLYNYVNNGDRPEDVIEALKEYEEKLVELGKEKENRFKKFPDLEKQYLRTLKDKPWEKCDCHICRSFGPHVCIFRSNERNMRRGFHDLYNFYKRFQKFLEGELEIDDKAEKWVQPTFIKEINHNDFKNSKVLVITACTADKLSNEHSKTAKAKEMYTGRLFKNVRKFCEAKKWDYKIISAKYGILDPEDEIKGYEKVLERKKDVENIKPHTLYGLTKILPEYDKILVIAGKKYREVIDPIMDYRFYILESKGYGDLSSKVKRAIPNKAMKLTEFEKMA